MSSVKTDRSASDLNAAGSSISDDRLQAFLGYRIKRAFNVIQSDLNRALAPLDLRMMTFSALVLVVENPGSNQSQLAKALQVEKPNMVAIIDELESREWLIRERLPTDRRSYSLQATAAGRRLCKRALKAVAEHEERLFSNLDALQQQKLGEMMVNLRHTKERHS